MESFKNGSGKIVVEAMIATIRENTAYLSEVDGAIGDGDHGINMNKGFSMCADAMSGKDLSLSDALMVLGKTLLGDIGGSMGPLYGGFFKSMARASKDQTEIDGKTFLAMLDAGVASIQNIGNAQPGDKTLLDTLIPARDSLRSSVDKGLDFNSALDDLIVAAEAGMLSTKNLVAKIGRAARLGERSRGVLDAGATSCYLLLKAMGSTMKSLLSTS
jgi:phosphoenolpyruvate---glycerone phosphotransferase subunit DhaL